MVSSILYQRDTVTHPLTYDIKTFHNSSTANITPPVFSKTSTPVLHNGYITTTCAKLNESPSTVFTKNTQYIISSNPILYTSFESIFLKIPSVIAADKDSRILIVSHSFFSNWWNINDVIGSQCYRFQSKGAWRWHCRYIFTMEQVVLSFGMVLVVVVDADSKFLNLFQDMCQRQDFIFLPLARGNHKGNSVEKYHRFLNKT